MQHFIERKLFPEGSHLTFKPEKLGRENHPHIIDEVKEPVLVLYMKCMYLWPFESMGSRMEQYSARHAERCERHVYTSSFSFLFFNEMEQNITERRGQKCKDRNLVNYLLASRLVKLSIFHVGMRCVLSQALSVCSVGCGHKNVWKTWRRFQATGGRTRFLII